MTETPTFPQPQKPQEPIEHLLDQLRTRAQRLARAELGPMISDSGVLGILAALIAGEIRGSTANAEREWQLADRTHDAAAAIQVAVPENASAEARQAAASQARRHVRGLEQQSGKHSQAAMAWESRADVLSASLSKLAAPVSAPVVEVPRGPMAAALDSINREMVPGGAK